MHRASLGARGLRRGAVRDLWTTARGAAAARPRVAAVHARRLDGCGRLRRPGARRERGPTREHGSEACRYGGQES